MKVKFRNINIEYLIMSNKTNLLSHKLLNHEIHETD